MSKKTKTTIAVTVLASSVYLSGCGLLSFGEKEKIDPPEDVSYLQEGETVETVVGEGTSTEEVAQDEEADKTVMTELYLIDENGYVVSQTLPLPNTESVAKQALEHLVVNGPAQNIIPNGFRAVIPADTQMTVNVKDNTAVVDFSQEFANYQPADEQKILQSVTWTLTQFDSIDKVQLRVNGYDLTEMPVNGTPISEDGLSRTMGINYDASGVLDITNTKPVTVYYVAQNGDSTYYVPVTKRVADEGENQITTVLNELIEGPGYASTLVSDFTGVKLLEEPTIKDGAVTLNFNEAVYGSVEEKMISEHMLNSLVLSLTEQAGVNSVSVQVNGEATVVNGNGEEITQPVTRPKNINAISF